MKERLATLLSRQFNHELYSAYIYLGFSHFYARLGLSGFAHWFNMQAREEISHAEKFMHYLEDCGEAVSFSEIPKMEHEPSKITDPLHAALGHEKYITSMINTLYSEAQKDEDYRTMQFLGYFIAEQAEEEKSAAALLSQVTMLEENAAGLYTLDRELAKREF